MFSWTRQSDGATVSNTSSLTVIAEGADDAGGMYRCDVTNPAGSGFATSTLNGEIGINLNQNGVVAVS